MGHQLFPIQSLDLKDASNIEASVLYFCLKNQTAFLDVTLTKVAGYDVAHLKTGFSASFRQSLPVELLRLRTAPLGYFPYTFVEDDDWVNPTANHKVVIEDRPLDSLSNIPQGLDGELTKLEILKLHLTEIEEEVKEQEKIIMKMWKEDFSKCTGIKCYITTAFAKAPAFVRLIADHFHHHSHVNVSFFQNATHANCSDSPGLLITQPKASEANYDELDVVASVEEATTSDEHVASATSSSPEPTKEPENQPHGPPWGHGPPPWAKPGAKPWWVKPGGRPPWAGSNWKGGPPPWVHGWKGGPPPWAHGWKGGPPRWHDQPGRPHPHHPTAHDIFPSLTSQQIFKIRVVGALVGLMIVVLFVGAVLACVKFKAQLWCDPRCRVDLIALREEWKTRRAYRKAACKYRFRTFLKRFRFKSDPDEEEKQAMLAPRDDVVVNREISNLRAAHQMVGDMMRAEEGQSRFTHPTRHSRSASGSESLPSYRSGPPGYESGMEGDISVVDGFTGYTPSVTEDTPSATDESPDTDSSIVDCSPRLSFETQRTF